MLCIYYVPQYYEHCSNLMPWQYSDQFLTREVHLAWQSFKADLPAHQQEYITHLRQTLYIWQD